MTSRRRGAGGGRGFGPRRACADQTEGREVGLLAVLASAGGPRPRLRSLAPVPAVLHWWTGCVSWFPGPETLVTAVRVDSAGARRPLLRGRPCPSSPSSLAAVLPTDSGGSLSTPRPTWLRPCGPGRDQPSAAWPQALRGKGRTGSAHTASLAHLHGHARGGASLPLCPLQGSPRALLTHAVSSVAASSALQTLPLMGSLVFAFVVLQPEHNSAAPQHETPSVKLMAILQFSPEKLGGHPLHVCANSGLILLFVPKEGTVCPDRLTLP